jgi:hypothetical protein
MMYWNFTGCGTMSSSALTLYIDTNIRKAVSHVTSGLAEALRQISKMPLEDTESDVPGTVGALVLTR